MADRRIRFISAGLFERAKQFWLTAMGSKTAIALLGMLSAYFHNAMAYFAIGILALEVLASFSFFRADKLKSEAEPILMRLDYEESLGWAIPDSSKSEWAADFANFESLGARIRTDEPYFAQGGATGFAILRRNMLESALYTRTIAANAKGVVLSLFALLLISFVTLLVTGWYELLSEPSEPASTFFTDALIVLVALDLLPLALRYGELAIAATKLRLYLNSLTTPTDSTVMPAVIEYQVARAYAPLLPTFAFLARRLPLASIWSRYENGESQDE